MPFKNVPLAKVQFTKSFNKADFVMKEDLAESHGFLKKKKVY